MAAVLHQEIVHELNTDCVEFCPSAEHPDWLALGCYQLDEKTGDRHGGLDLFRVTRRGGGGDRGGDHGGGESGDAAPRLKLAASTRGLPGVFDARWHRFDAGRWSLALALSDGTLRLFRPPPLGGGGDGAAAAAGDGGGDDDDDGGAAAAAAAAVPQLEEIDSCRAVTEMALCVDWATLGGGGGEGGDDGGSGSGGADHVAVVSSSSGTLTLLQAAEAGLRRLNEWAAHDLEVWVAAFDKHRPRLLYSGADDGAFKGWDARVAAPALAWPPLVARRGRGGRSGGGGGSDSGSGSDSDGSGGGAQLGAFVNRKSHAAGVCCVASHPKREFLVTTGSYDEAVRLWDVRRLQRPVVAAQVAAGGGAWRFKWHPQDPHLALVACMYNGFAIARASEAFDALEVVEAYKGHESIAYGADWHPTAAAEASAAARARAGGPGEGGADAEQAAAEAEAAAADAPEAAAGGGRGFANLVATCSFYDRRLHLWTPATRAKI